jgi:anaphase-promoting complex subunit 8
LNHSIKTIDDFEVSANLKSNSLSGISPEDYDNYFLAKTYFDCREYDRAAYFTNSCSSPVPSFLNRYSMYMAKEKKRLDNTPDNSTMSGNSQLKDLTELMSILHEEYNLKKLDGYGMYLYGVVLKKLDLTSKAITVFLECVHLVPTLWSAWIELAPLIQDADQLRGLSLPKHWIKPFFIGHTFIEIFVNETGISLFEEIQQAGFEKSIYVTSQIAIAYHNKRDVDRAIEIFQEIQTADPYRLENLDMYSNLLFVREEKMKMAHLANHAVEINKYRPETCCVIGNYCSIRGEHQKAILYFQRALKLNPKYLSAWTLMGHEFMEMKNTNAAIHSYRQAVEVNRRDFRAWYGLGQAYEIIKMPFYGLYYYKIATQLRPYDSRMLLALGETYEKLEKTSNAIKCYQKACNVGDIEGYAMFKLGSLYEKLGDRENAVNAYQQYVNDERPNNDKNSLIQPYIYLANYYVEKKNFDKATYFAHKVLEQNESNQEAKAILRTISSSRTKQDDDMTEAIMELEQEETELIAEENSGELDMEMSMT